MTRKLWVLMCFFALAACSAGNDQLSEHTQESLVKALTSESANGLDCALEDNPAIEGDPYWVICESTGQGLYDSRTLFSLAVNNLNFAKTKELYQRFHESACSREIQSYESEVLGGTRTYNAYDDLTKDSWIVIGKNWASISRIYKQTDAEQVAQVTGGIVVKGSDWCANPRPLVDFGA